MLDLILQKCAFSDCLRQLRVLQLQLELSYFELHLEVLDGVRDVLYNFKLAMLAQLGYQAVVEGQSCAIVDHMLRLHARSLKCKHLFQVIYVFKSLVGRLYFRLRTFFKVYELSNKFLMLLGE